MKPINVGLSVTHARTKSIIHQGKITPPGTCPARRSPCNSVSELSGRTRCLFSAQHTCSIFPTSAAGWKAAESWWGQGAPPDFGSTLQDAQGQTLEVYFPRDTFWLCPASPCCCPPNRAQSEPRCNSFYTQLTVLFLVSPPVHTPKGDGLLGAANHTHPSPVCTEPMGVTSRDGITSPPVQCTCS